MQFECRCENWALKKPFVISREKITTVPILFFSLSYAGHTGRAEAVGVDYRGETPINIAKEIRQYLSFRKTPPNRADLLVDLPAGGARNAIDCALWDLEAKQAGKRVWELAGLNEPVALATVYTISLGAPDTMAAELADAPEGAMLKLKLGGSADGDIKRVQAVRRTAPNARIVVDANEAWSLETLNTAAPHMAELGVELIEQPLPAGHDDNLRTYCGAVPLCADESFNDISSLPAMKYYNCVNIKLDKTGGFTAALAAAKGAKDSGLDLFVGCMLGTSLGMAPAFLIGQLCQYIDLDGPLLMNEDRPEHIRYTGTNMEVFGPGLWG